MLLNIERMYRLILSPSLLILLWSSLAHAYVDPGVLSSLYNLGYILVVGFLGFFVFRPFRFFKQLFSSNKGKEKDPPSSDPK